MTTTTTASLSISNFTQDLYEALGESRASLDAAVAQEMRVATEAAQRAKRQIAEQQQAIDAASAKLLALEMNGLSVNKEDGGKNTGGGGGNNTVELQDMDKKVQQQEAVNSELEVSLQTQKKQVEDLLTEHKHQKARVLQTKQLKDATEAAKQTTVDDLTRGIVNYKYLGLDFEKADNDRLRFSFTQLDPENPERKFSFELDATNDEETWSVVELDPPGMISEDLLEQLLVPLNETNDMISFVQGMRESFLERL